MSNLSTNSDSLDNDFILKLINNVQDISIVKCFEIISVPCVYFYLPLITSYIKEVGKDGKKREMFLQLIDTFLLKLRQSRSLKLYFLMLLRNLEFSKYWKVDLILDNQQTSDSARAESEKDSEELLESAKFISHFFQGHKTRIFLGDKDQEDASPKSDSKSSSRGVGAVQVEIFVDLLDIQTVDFFHSQVFAPPPKTTTCLSPGETQQPQSLEKSKWNVLLFHPMASMCGFANRVEDRSRKVLSNLVAKQNKESAFQTLMAQRQTGKPLTNKASDGSCSPKGKMISPRGQTRNAGTTFDHGTSALTNSEEEKVMSRVVIEKVFSSIAAPILLSFSYLRNGSKLTDNAFVEQSPRMIAKTGDNLFQDLGCQVVFRGFNQIWRESMKETDMFANETQLPFIQTYNVLPTSSELKQGLIEVVSPTKALKDFNWDEWKASCGEATVNRMILSSAGSLIGGFVLGVRDRHWDNILIAQNDTLLHIDFGYLLGASPPIDAPSFSVSSKMKETFTDLGKWALFVKYCVSAFLILRRRAPQVIQLCRLVFGQTGWSPDVVEAFLKSRQSLMLDLPEAKAQQVLEQLLECSATSWQNMFKQLSHNTIDPVYYKMLKVHFPVAVFAQAIVNYKGKKKDKKRKNDKQVVEEDLSVIQVRK